MYVERRRKLELIRATDKMKTKRFGQDIEQLLNFPLITIHMGQEMESKLSEVRRKVLEDIISYRY